MKKEVLIPFDKYERWKALADQPLNVGSNMQPKPIKSTSEVIEEESIGEEKHVPKEEALKNKRFDDVVILACVKKSNRERVKLLLQNMEWNEKGEVMIGGVSRKGSHIIDILQRTLYGDDEDNDDSDVTVEDNSTINLKRKWIEI